MITMLPMSESNLVIKYDNYAPLRFASGVAMLLCDRKQFSNQIRGHIFWLNW
ncbi:25217_t:CDS:1, partial [Dentiscutata erythropus]